jgi:hypothetical protein
LPGFDRFEVVIYCEMCRKLRPFAGVPKLCGPCQKQMREDWPDAEPTK